MSVKIKLLLIVYNRINWNQHGGMDPNDLHQYQQYDPFPPRLHAPFASSTPDNVVTTNGSAAGIVSAAVPAVITSATPLFTETPVVRADDSDDCYDERSMAVASLYLYLSEVVDLYRSNPRSIHLEETMDAIVNTVWIKAIAKRAKFIVGDGNITEAEIESLRNSPHGEELKTYINTTAIMFLASELLFTTPNGGNIVNNSNSPNKCSSGTQTVNNDDVEVKREVCMAVIYILCICT
jgi:hypothetical protein